MGRIPLFVLAIGLVALCAACASDTLSGDHQENQAPTVWLSSGPPEGSTGTYTVTLFWGGWDPDGEIRYYEYLVTDNITGVFNPADTTGADWLPVVGNDSTFVFSADSLLDNNPSGQKAVFIRSHTFFIRAVDEDNARSKEPAYRSFTSRTISPEVRVTTPRAELGITPADMPPISTISWIATDYVDDDISKQDPDSVQWAMVSTKDFGDYAATINYLRTNPDAPEWYPWSWYKAPADSGKSWTTPPLEFGDYVFAIRAKDEAGAITPVLTEPVNVRRVKVQARNSGPTFIITSDLLGSIIAASCDYPLTIVDVPAGVDLSFSLSACAEHYGGTVSGYRYGWDILDLEDPSQWETDYTPFITAVAKTPPRAFNFGTHTFTAEVIDNSGFCSRIEVKVNVIRFSGERNLMVVDDYRADENPGSGWQSTNGGVPSDAEHDFFWLDMVSNLEGFDATRDMIAISVDRELPLTTIAAYKSIIWSAYSDVDMRLVGELPLLYTYIQYRSQRPPANTLGACSPTGGVSGKVLPNYISLAMRAGVHVLITGTHPAQNALSRTNSPAVKWPALPLYEFERGAQQTGSGPDSEDIENPPGDHAFAYKDLCLDVIDFGYQSNGRIRSRGTGSVANQRYCPTNGWRTPNGQSRRDDGLRFGISADPNFPQIDLRPEAANPGRLFAPTSQAIDTEVYNPEYFRQGAACDYVLPPRPCFEPIYLLGCLDTDERTYQQPVAFWTSAHADVVSEDIPGAVAARSAVFGFPPVYFNPGQVKPGIEYILFDEWQLPRKSGNSQTASQARLDGTGSSH